MTSIDCFKSKDYSDVTFIKVSVLFDYFRSFQRQVGRFGVSLTILDKHKGQNTHWRQILQFSWFCLQRRFQTALHVIFHICGIEIAFCLLLEHGESHVKFPQGCIWPHCCSQLNYKIWLTNLALDYPRLGAKQTVPNYKNKSKTL